MILDNGTIEVKSATQGGLVNGIPQKAVSSWEKPMPCHIVANINDNKGTFTDGNFKRTAFTVWLDSPLYYFKAERVRLTDNKGVILGEFEVQSIEVSALTGRTKVVV